MGFEKSYKEKKIMNDQRKTLITRRRRRKPEIRVGDSGGDSGAISGLQRGCLRRGFQFLVVEEGQVRVSHEEIDHCF